MSYQFSSLPLGVPPTGYSGNIRYHKSGHRALPYRGKRRTQKGIKGRANRLLNIRASTAPEVRWFELSASHDFQTGASTMIHLTPIAKGDSIKGRDTNKVRAVNINIAMILDPDPQNTTIGWYARLIMFKVKRVNGTIPPTDDILQADAAAPISIRHYNPLQMGKNIKIVWDKFITQDNENMKALKFTVNKKINTQITWDVGNTVGTIGGSQNNHYFLFAFCSTASEDVAPRLYYSCVIRFMDE